MPFALERFATLRPWLYHLTVAANVDRIRRTGTLTSAADLLAAAGRPELAAARRVGPQPVRIGEEAVIVNDQDPLLVQHVTFEDDWTFADLLVRLNSLVFFWPGDADGPINPGVRHFGRYRRTKPPPIVLRFPTAAVVAANPERAPLFGPYNSGAPNPRGIPPSPRGPNTFRPADAFAGTASKVVEVTFEHEARLPSGGEARELGTTEWKTIQNLATEKHGRNTDQEKFV